MARNIPSLSRIFHEDLSEQRQPREQHTKYRRQGMAFTGHAWSKIYQLTVCSASSTIRNRQAQKWLLEQNKKVTYPPSQIKKTQWLRSRSRLLAPVIVPHTQERIRRQLPPGTEQREMRASKFSVYCVACLTVYPRWASCSASRIHRGFGNRS